MLLYFKKLCRCLRTESEPDGTGGVPLFVNFAICLRNFSSSNPSASQRSRARATLHSHPSAEHKQCKLESNGISLKTGLENEIAMTESWEFSGVWKCCRPTRETLILGGGFLNRCSLPRSGYSDEPPKSESGALRRRFNLLNHKFIVSFHGPATLVPLGSHRENVGSSEI
jgi:hypothetical protein